MLTNVEQASRLFRAMSGVMPDLLGFGSESHTPEQSQQRNHLSHAYSTATSHGPQFTPVANALVSKTPVSALFSKSD